MAALSLFCERAWLDYPFDICIGLPTYIDPLVNPNIRWQQWLKTHSGGSEFSLTQSLMLQEEFEDSHCSKLVT